MRKVFTVSAFALFGLMVVPANAMPFPPLSDGLSGVTPAAFGCGPGWTWALWRVPSILAAMALPGHMCDGAYGYHPYAHGYGYHPYAHRYGIIPTIADIAACEAARAA